MIVQMITAAIGKSQGQRASMAEMAEPVRFPIKMSPVNGVDRCTGDMKRQGTTRD
jgi:hypothetical protein